MQPISGSVPALFTNAGGHAAGRSIEFFITNIRNPHTWAIYVQAVTRFARWREAYHLRLAHLIPSA